MALLQQALRYAPACIVPAFVSLAIVVVFTRLLTPAEYGRYALVVATVQLLQVFCLQWLRVGVVRFYSVAEKNNRVVDFLSTIYSLLALLLLITVSALSGVALGFYGSDALGRPLLFGCILLVFQSFVQQNLRIHRAAQRVIRYSIIECTRSLLGLACALFFVIFFDGAERGLILGLAGGYGIVAVLDVRWLRNFFVLRSLDKQEVRKLVRYGMALAPSFALEFVVSTSDRYMLQYFIGVDAVGSYSAGYGVAFQSISMLFVIVNLAAFPLAVKLLEYGGIEAARRQLRATAVLLLLITVPATAGVVFLSGPIAGVLLGEKFAGGATEIVPYIAVAAFCWGLKFHFFDQGFQLAHRPEMSIWTNGFSAITNICLNVILISWLGPKGAVFATLVAYLVGLLSSIVLVQRVFRVPFPAQAAFRIFFACVGMVLVLLLVPKPDSVLSLVGTIAAGAGIYGGFCMLFDVPHARSLFPLFKRAS